MKGNLQKFIMGLLSVVMFFSSFTQAVSAQEETVLSDDNIARNAVVSYSGVEGGKNPDGSWLHAKFAGEMVNDGDAETRWSADKIDYQWIELDLQDTYLLNLINVNFHATAPKYDVSISVDGENYTKVYETNEGGHNETKIINIPLEYVEARYVRYEQHKQFKHSVNGQFYGSSINEIGVFGEAKLVETGNIALNKSVTYSGVEGGKVGETWKYPQFIGEMAVDGDTGTRWSADKYDDQWLTVDLGKNFKIDKVILNFHAETTDYSVLVSADGTSFTEVHKTTTGSKGDTVIKEVTFDAVDARYVKYQQHKQWLHSNKKYYGSSLYELEVYSFEEVEEVDDSRIRVGTFNIAAGMKPDINTLRTFINTQKFDVIGLQEVDKFTQRNNKDMLHEIAVGLFDHEFFSMAIRHEGGEYGVGILSNSEMIEKDKTFVTTLDGTEDRVFQRIVVKKGDKEIAIYNTHLSFETVEIKQKQYLEILEALNNDPVEYKIVMGDFNADQYNSEFYTFFDDLNSINGIDGNWYESFNGIDYDMYTNAVDNIMYTKNLKLVDQSMVNAKHVSDHHMLSAEFEFADEDILSKEYLGHLIRDAKAVDLDNISENTKKELSKALAESLDVYNNAILQSEVDAQKDTLHSVLKDLEYINFAKGRNVKYSGVEGGKVGETWKYPQFAGYSITDGNIKSRWSADKKDNQWTIIDLEYVRDVKDFIVYIHATSPDYEILISEDGVNYTSVHKVVDGAHGEEEKLVISLDAPLKAKYIKYQQNKQWLHSNNQKYGSSIYEFEAYKDLKIEAISLNKKKEVLGVNDELNLTATIFPQIADFKELEWVSDNTDVATVVNGLVKSHKVGTAEIKVMAKDDHSIYATFSLEVVEGDLVIQELIMDDIELYHTQKRFLKYTVYPEKSVNRDAEVMWELEDKTLGDIDPKTAHFTPLKVGSTKVKVSLKDDPSIFTEATLMITKEDVDEAYPIMNERWLQRVVGGDNDLSNAEVKAYIDQISEDTELLLATMNREANRTNIWNQLSSDTTSANYTTQFGKIKRLALGFGVKGSKYYQDKEVLKDIVESIEFMIVNKRYDGKYSSGNWWDWQIGTTHHLVDTLFVIAPYLESDQVEFFVKPLEGYAQKPSIQWGGYNATGANRTDIGISVLGSAILARKDVRMDLVKNEVPQVFKIVTGGDGIYKDGSLVQHNNIAYTGSYGNELVKGIGRIQSVTAGTKWSFEEAGLQSVFHLIDKGYIPLMYHGKMMNMVNGRSISRAPGTNPFTTEFEAGSETISNIMAVSEFAPAQYKAKFEGALKQWLITSEAEYGFMEHARDMGSLVSAQQILEDDSIKALEREDEAVIYGSMARAVQNSKNYSFGVSMFNRKIANYEFGNTENARGWFTGVGALYFYNQDLDQFGEGYWPTVDSYHIPGTTVDTKALANGANSGKLNGDSWVGGTHNGKYASVGMKYDAVHTNANTKANKSWFMMDGYVLALGSDISGSTSATIDTTIENRMLQEAGNKITINGSDEVSTKKDLTLTDNEYVHLEGDEAVNDISYIFPKGAQVSVEKETRQGKYADINTYFVNDKTYIKDYFKMIQSHGNNPTSDEYSYIILPGKTTDETEAFIAEDRVEILAQDSIKHAVYDKESDVFMMNVYSDSGVDFESIKVDRAASVTVSKVKDQIIITVSEPRQNNATINLEYKDAYYNVVSLSDGISNSGDGKFSINSAQSAGATYTIVLQGDVDKSELEALYNVVKDLDETVYTPETIDEVIRLRDEAKVILDDSNAIQTDVDAAYDALSEAYKTLNLRADLDAIKTLIIKVKNLNLLEYNQEDADAFEALITLVEGEISNENITQERVDELKDDLQEAFDNLVKLNLDASELVRLITQINALDLSLYKEEGVTPLKAKLLEAKEIVTILAQRNVTDRRITQAEINRIAGQLQQLLDDLELLDVPVEPEDLDYSKLEELMKQLSKLKLSEYTTESITNLQTVLSEITAELLRDDLTQEELDALTLKLQAALYKLEKVKGDEIDDKEKDKDVPTGISQSYAMYSFILMSALVLVFVLLKRRKRI